MIKPYVIKDQALDAFTSYAREGFDSFLESKKIFPILSHLCFKFHNMNSYKQYVGEAKNLGWVIQQEFNGKEISWCKLKEPLKGNGLVLEWLELVEPKIETNAFDGVTSLAYHAEGLADTQKVSSRDKVMTFRYQPKSVHP